MHIQKVEDPGKLRNIRTSVDLTTAVTATAAASGDTSGLLPVNPGGVTYATATKRKP